MSAGKGPVEVALPVGAGQSPSRRLPAARADRGSLRACLSRRSRLGRTALRSGHMTLSLGRGKIEERARTSGDPWRGTGVLGGPKGRA